MSSDWMNEFSETKPEEFVQLNDDQWLQHVNIREDTMTMENPEGQTEEISGYSFETRVMDKKEYLSLINTLYTPAQKETKSMMVNSDDNQTVLMEALAEIYEMLAMLLPEEEEE